MTIDDKAERLHATYVHCSGLERRFIASDRWVWERWLHEGFVEADLTLVIDYIKVRQKEGKRSLEALRFCNLIENAGQFADDLASAKARARLPKVDKGRAQVLQATGRPVESQGNKIKTPEQIMRDIKAFEDFKAFGRSLRT